MRRYVVEIALGTALVFVGACNGSNVAYHDPGVVGGAAGRAGAGGSAGATQAGSGGSSGIGGATAVESGGQSSMGGSLPAGMGGGSSLGGDTQTGGTLGSGGRQQFGSGGTTSTATGGASATGGAGATGGTMSAGTGGSRVPDAGVASGALPCDVQTLVANRCDSCHGSLPSGGAPRSLVTYADLTRADPSSAGMTEAQVALQRMQNAASPMPPSPASPATTSEIATLQDWINNGYPSGSCAGVDGGATKPDPLNATPTCTSKTNWTGGTNGSSSMEPGQACIACHSKGGDGPRYVIAGTLYPTGHEPDNCNGVNGSTSGAKVIIADSKGTSVSLTPNSVGNFYSSTTLSPPYKAKVVNSAGLERVMSATLTTGDCKSCHTQNGANGAPGRITLP